MRLVTVCLFLFFKVQLCDCDIFIFCWVLYKTDQLVFAEPESSVNVGVCFFLFALLVTRVICTSCKKQLGPKLLEGFVPVFLRKPKATCVFPRGSGTPVDPHPLWIRHAYSTSSLVFILTMYLTLQ